MKAKKQATRLAVARRKRGFRAIAIAVPLVNLILLELVLRAVGFGYPASFFLRAQANGEPVFIENQEFSRRYFPPGLERTSQPVMFRAVKPPDTFRVFIFGESAAMGDPEPAFGLARVLEVLLRDVMPGRKIEVINVAVTAINSHVVREIAKDCANKQGDYWVVYMGHNEVVGPFGAGTVFGTQIPGFGFIRASLALKSTRLGQLLDAIRIRLTRKSGVPAKWEGMEMFLKQQVAQDDPRMAKVYEHFRTNLREIIRLGEASGAKVLVSTVASNLKDCPPFASLRRPGLAGARQAEWEKLYQAGITHEKGTNQRSALAAYRRAEELDGRHAELHFRRGQCHLALGQLGEASGSLELARDLDTLRFRADGSLNQIIRQTAASHPELDFLDAVELIATNSPHNIAGEEFFFEHVHLNFAGNYLIARGVAQQILREATKAPPLPSSDECARRLAFTEFNRFRLLDEVRKRLQQAPFTWQLYHEQRDHRLKEQLDRLGQASLGSAMQRYEQAIDGAPDDWVLRENFATLLQDFGQPRAAEEHWRKVIQLLPHYDEAYYGLANALDLQGRSGEAAIYFREALRRRPGSIEARNGLALALANLGQDAAAVAEFERAIRQQPDFAEARINLGQILARQGKRGEARVHYFEALRLESNNVAAHLNLGKLLAQEARFGEAVAHYREAIRLQPGSAIAHFNLGNALNAQGDATNAANQFAEAVRCDPNFAEARYNLALGLARQNRNFEALTNFSEAVRLKPDFTEAHFNLGVAYANAFRYDEAIREFQEVLRRAPDHGMAQKFLERALAAQRKSP